MVYNSWITIAVIAAFAVLIPLARRQPAVALVYWVIGSTLLKHYVLFPEITAFNAWVNRVLLSGLLLGLIIRWLIDRVPLSLPNRHEISMLFFILWALVSAYVSSNIFRPDAKDIIGNLINGFVIPFSMFYFARSVRPQMPRLRTACLWLAPLLGYLIFTAFAENFHLEWLVFPHYILDPEIGIHYERARGPLASAVENGVMLSMLLIIVVHLGHYMWSQSTRRILFPFMFIGTLMAIYFTQTRGVWVAAGAAFIVMLFHTRAKLCFVSVIVILSIGITWYILFPSEFVKHAVRRSETIEYRLKLYHESIEVLGEHPLTGWGWGTFTSKARKFRGNVASSTLQEDVQHDTLMAIATDTGILGAALYLVAIGLIFGSLLQKRKKAISNGEQRDFCITCIAVGMIYIVNGIFADSRYFLCSNSIFFIAAGFALGFPNNNTIKGESSIGKM